MDQIAVISDIHGNVPALQAVLNDIARRSIRTVFCLGDMIGKGPQSDVAVDLCRERCAVTIKGNWEDDFWGARAEPIVAWHIERLGMARVAALNELPFCHDFLLSGRRVRLLHGSAESTSGYVKLEDALSVKAAIFHNTRLTGYENPEPDVVGYGHIHKAYSQHAGRGRILFNAGSVGNPTDEATASYAVLHGVLDSAETASFSLELVRVPYDIELAVKLARDADLPDLAAYEFELRTARYRGEMYAD